MGFQLLPPPLREDLLVLRLDDPKREALERILDDLLRAVPGKAWLVDVDGLLLAKAGDPPSDLSFEIRKESADAPPEPPGAETLRIRGPREGVYLRRVPPTVSLALPAKAVLTIAPAAQRSAAEIEPLLRDVAARLLRLLQDGLWILPPMEVVVLHEGGGGPPSQRA